MAITREQIEALARLSKLEFSEEEIGEFAQGFEEIVRFADRINERVAGDNGSIREVTDRTVGWDDLREDEVVESLSAEKITSNVQSENGCFAVRRVVR